MHLRKIDYLTALIASLSFVGCSLGIVLALTYGLKALGWGQKTDAGIVLAPLAFLIAIPSAWFGSYWILNYISRRTNQLYAKETFSHFAYLVFGSFIITVAIGSFNGRAYFTVPVLLLSLALAYLLARIITLKQKYK